MKKTNFSMISNKDITMSVLFALFGVAIASLLVLFSGGSEKLAMNISAFAAVLGMFAACKYCKSDELRAAYDLTFKHMGRVKTVTTALVAFGVLNIAPSFREAIAEPFAMYSAMLTMVGLIGWMKKNKWDPWGGEKVRSFKLSDMLAVFTCMAITFGIMVVLHDNLLVRLEGKNYDYYIYFFSSLLALTLVSILACVNPRLRAFVKLLSFMFSLIGLGCTLMNLTNGVILENALFADDSVLAYAINCLAGYAGGASVAGWVNWLVEEAYIDQRGEQPLAIVIADNMAVYLPYIGWWARTDEHKYIPHTTISVTSWMALWARKVRQLTWVTSLARSHPCPFLYAPPV